MFNATIYSERPTSHAVKDTGTPKGRGVYSIKGYRQGDLIECSPVVILTTEPTEETQRYTYEWDVGHAIALGHGTLFNHHNPANMRYEQDYQNREIRFYAARDIREGEELTINYNSNGEPEWPDNNWFDHRNIKPL
jgi:SET domain-containing protein